MNVGDSGDAFGVGAADDSTLTVLDFLFAVNERTTNGVLYDLDGGGQICASNTDLPPSEEVLSMLFSIEHFEDRFLRSGHGMAFQ